MSAEYQPSETELLSAFNNACLSSAFNESQPGRPSENAIRELRRVRDAKHTWVGASEQCMRFEIDRMLREHLHILDGARQ